jgi:hypothetical protein
MTVHPLLELMQLLALRINLAPVSLQGAAYGTGRERCSCCYRQFDLEKTCYCQNTTAVLQSSSQSVLLALLNLNCCCTKLVGILRT